MISRFKEEILSMNENKIEKYLYVNLFCFFGVKDCIRYRDFKYRYEGEIIIKLVM